MSVEPKKEEEEALGPEENFSPPIRFATTTRIIEEQLNRRTSTYSKKVRMSRIWKNVERIFLKYDKDHDENLSQEEIYAHFRKEFPGISF